MATFSIVSMMREDLETVTRFVDYYRKQGVEKIFIYFDGAIDHLQALGGDDLEIVECSQEFWQPMFGERPSSLLDAQSFVYKLALSKCSSDWLFVTDADEYFFGDRKIPEFLAAVPADLDVVVVQSAEAIWGPGDPIDEAFGSQYFRTGISNTSLWYLLGAVVYGPVGKLFNAGILSHALGKQFIRSDREYDIIGNHNSRRDGKNLGKWAHNIDPALGNIYVGHFDAICFSRWLEKWRLRLVGETNILKMGYKRKRQMELVGEAVNKGREAEVRLFRKFFHVSSLQYQMLRLFGKAFQRNIFEE